MKFSYSITLKADEEFVRLKMCVENPTDASAWGEAWLPMTFPIDSDSQIISPQRKRWRRDEWCHAKSANIVDFEGEELLHPLRWKGSGIYYDWPMMDGNYHAVNLPSQGRGVAYVTDSTTPHFTKLWSWGDKQYWNPKNVLEQGRPATEYYEPWGSAFNFAFFQTAQFQPHSSSSWTAAIVPLDSGMEDADVHFLRRATEAHLTRLNVPTSPAVISGERLFKQFR